MLSCIINGSGKRPPLLLKQTSVNILITSSFILMSFQPDTLSLLLGIYIGILRKTPRIPGRNMQLVTEDGLSRK